MSDLVAELKNEHVFLVDTLHKAKDLIVTSEERQSTLHDAKNAFLAHLKKEDEQLYPVLCKAAENDVELKQTLGCSVELATFNTSILKRYTLSKDDNSIKQLTGRGGTSLACVHDDIKIKESKLKDEAENIYIILSDLQCTPMQKIKGINLVTICTNNPSAKVLGGKLIHVEV